MFVKRLIAICSVAAAVLFVGSSAFAAQPVSQPGGAAPHGVVQPDSAIVTNFDGFNLQVFGTALHVDQIWVGYVGGFFQDSWCGIVAWSVNGTVDEDSEFHICGSSDSPDWGYEDVNQSYANGTEICEVIVNSDPGYGGSLTSLPCATVHS